jgi:predicted dienelactone hydrolase
MRLVYRVLAVTAVLLAGAHAWADALTRRTEHGLGFQVTGAADADGKPFPVGVWYPADIAAATTTQRAPNPTGAIQDAPVFGKGLPLVVISHGNGGGMASHIDLALALAQAGYVVAAPVHAGDNFQDTSASGLATLFSGRNRQLRATIDHMLAKWKRHDAIDPARVGAFGFSAGGFTALTAVGAQPDMKLIASQCVHSPEFICQVLAHFKSPLLSFNAPAGEPMQASPQVKAVVAAGPGLGFTMTQAAMADVKVPVQLWSGEKDETVPYATNAKPIIEALGKNGQKVDFHAIPNASHLSFLAPCGPVKVPELCMDPEGFDRVAFHAAMNVEVIKFFDRTLKH